MKSKNIQLLAIILSLSLTPSLSQAQNTPPPEGTSTLAKAKEVMAMAKAKLSGRSKTTAPVGATSTVIALKDPVAIVDGTKISKSDLEKAFKEAVAASGVNPATLTADQKLQGYHQILDALIMEKLVDKKSAGIEVSDAEVTAEVDKIKKQFPNPDAFNAELKKSGQTMEQFTANLKKSMRQTKWMKSQMQGKEEITDAEAQKFYNDNIKQFAQPDMVKATHILFLVPAGASDKVVKAKEAAARAAIAQAQKDQAILAANAAVGKDSKEEQEATKAAVEKAAKAFSKMAMELSEEPGAKQRGGDLGFFGKSQMVPEFATAAFDQKVASISNVPVKTKFGYHVIMVTEKKAAATATFAEVKPNIIAYLKNQKRREAFKAVMQQLRQSAKIENFLPAPAVITPASMKPSATGTAPKGAVSK